MKLYRGCMMPVSQLRRKPKGLRMKPWGGCATLSRLGMRPNLDPESFGIHIVVCWSPFHFLDWRSCCFPYLYRFVCGSLESFPKLVDCSHGCISGIGRLYKHLECHIWLRKVFQCAKKFFFIFWSGLRRKAHRVVCEVLREVVPSQCFWILQSFSAKPESGCVKL